MRIGMSQAKKCVCTEDTGKLHNDVVTILCHCMPRSKFHKLGDHQSENYTVTLTTGPNPQGQGRNAQGQRQRQRLAKVQGLMVECDHYQTRICILYSKC